MYVGGNHGITSLDVEKSRHMSKYTYKAHRNEFYTFSCGKQQKNLPGGVL